MGYAILFVGFILFYRGLHCLAQEDPVNGHNSILIGISIIIMIASFAWMLLKVRCPHCNQLLDLRLYNIDVCLYCNQLLDLRLYNIDVCPYCKKNTDSK